MYSASSAFHQNVAEGNKQMALLIFKNASDTNPTAVFTNHDIDISTGIEFNDYFNVEEDLAIGQALSNEVSFNLFNDEGLLDDYAFGDFQLLLGVKLWGDMYFTDRCKIYVRSTSHTYRAFSSSPYLTRDNTAVSSQPSAAIKSILIYNGIVYCKLVNGNVKAYTDSTGNAKSVSVNAFMKAQMDKWENKGIFYNKDSRILKVYRQAGDIYESNYEFVPLGWFTAERPNVPTVNLLHFHCNDFMMKFDRDMPTDASLNISSSDYTNGLKFKTLMSKMATAVGVTFDASSFTINGEAKISERLEECNGVNMREVVQWLAEAGGSVARFNRNGVLVFDWIRTNTGQTYDETKYSEFSPYWYQTKTVNRLYNRSSAGAYDKNVGSGSEAVLIQDNPFLKGVT